MDRTRVSSVMVAVCPAIRRAGENGNPRPRTVSMIVEVRIGRVNGGMSGDPRDWVVPCELAPRFGINRGQFVQQFNERTKEAGGMPIPVVVNVYSDRSFEFITKSPPASA